MFQYAFARSVAARHDAELVLDDWSGFVRDREYRRSFELRPLQVRGRRTNVVERLPIWMHRWQKRGERGESLVSELTWYGQFISETKREYIPEVLEVVPHKNTWCVGYWQSPRYFENCIRDLQRELMPPAPAEDRFLRLGGEMMSEESISVGIRLYEESKNPTAHALQGRNKTTGDIREAVQRMLCQRPRGRFYVFCTHRFPALAQCGFPKGTVYVTPDDGFVGTLGSLWLMTRCRHHIITNSTYYWWGAWLSKGVFPDDSQRVLAADNFVNSDALCDEWERF